MEVTIVDLMGDNSKNHIMIVIVTETVETSRTDKNESQEIAGTEMVDVTTGIGTETGTIGTGTTVINRTDSTTIDTTIGNRKMVSFNFITILLSFLRAKKVR